MLEVRRSRDRGYSDNGWLKTFHSFAFADYFDPEHVEFGPLRAINEARLKPGKGLQPTATQDMEILTLVLHGEMSRTDSLGKSSVLRVGDVHRATAGTGLEFVGSNPSSKEELHVLHLWLRPVKPGLPPSAETRHFDVAEKNGALKLIASVNGEAGSLRIHQDARIFTTHLSDTQKVSFEVTRNRCVYIHVARGSVAVNDTRLNTGDAMKVTQAARLTLQNGSDADVVILNLPVAQLTAALPAREKGPGSSADSGRRAGRRKATSDR